MLRANVILALFLSAAVFSGCVGMNKNAVVAPGTSNRNAENANAARSNLEELRLLINVPYETDDIVWKEDAAHKKLIAVLRFSTEDANKIVADAAARGAPQNVTVSSETWFPPELIAQSEMSGDDSLSGIAYAPDGFMQEPYTSGRVVRIDGTDYFVIEVAAK
jgi:hypothetical protein